MKPPVDLERMKVAKAKMREALEEYILAFSGDYLDPEEIDQDKEREEEDGTQPEMQGRVDLILTDFIVIGAQTGVDSKGAWYSPVRQIYSDDGMAPWKIRGLLHESLLRLDD